MKKLTHNFIKEQIEKVEGYKLLSKEYKNNHTKLLVKCNKGHNWQVRWNDFRNGIRCIVCSYIDKGRKLKLTYKFIKNQIENVEGYKLLSEEYKNNKIKLKIQCDKGHEYEATYRDFQQKCRCPLCAIKINSEKQKHSYKFIKEQIESVERYKLLSKEYINNKQKLLIKCDKGHEYEASYDKFKGKRRCPICDYNKTSSKAEKEILQIVKNILSKNEIIANNRTQILNLLTNKNLELDIWIPELNKAIEYNGEYWHNLEYQIIKDKIKVKQCKEKNIDLLIIQEQDWLNNKEKEIRKIKKWVL